MARKKKVVRRKPSAAGYRRTRSRVPRNAELDRELTSVVEEQSRIRDDILDRIARGILLPRWKRG
jgi:hypothetical protein